MNWLWFINGRLYILHNQLNWHVSKYFLTLFVNSDFLKPGDRVQVIGVYRCLPSKRQGFTPGTFRWNFINSFVHNTPFLCTLNLTVFWYFQRVKRGRIEKKWVKANWSEVLLEINALNPSRWTVHFRKLYYNKN